MRFGGHETFPIREGWLYKGLKLLMEEPARMADDDVADWLGVGRNMAKSIRHWLLAAKLARPSVRHGRGGSSSLEASPLGALVWERDPYFEDPGTWWAIHINLVTSHDQCLLWQWFFNVFGANRFERSVCLEAAERHFERTGIRMPSRKTLQRDVACLLSTYARSIPEEREDPEENLVCPLTELGLLTYYRGTGAYEANRGAKEIPAEIIGYSISRAIGHHDTDRHTDLQLSELWTLENGPARVFSLANEPFFETILRAADERPSEAMRVVGLAGERVLRIRNREPIDWLTQHYEVVGQTAERSSGVAV